ncbi:hypothetical protein IAU60_001887 [Kwoniella sp. DSM 27419]
MSAGPEYEEVPRPTRIKLKETKEEIAAKLYRREQRRHARETERISRANGYAVSPPRSTAREESMSPPRNPAKRARRGEGDELDERDGLDDGGQGEWMGGYGRRAREELDRREWLDKMAWMSHSSDNPFAGQRGEYHYQASYSSFSSHGGSTSISYSTYGYAGPADDVRIPQRFRESAGVAGPSTRARRSAVEEVEFEGGAVPPLGAMTDHEYTAWVRDGMYRRKHRAEVEASERRQRERAERDRQKEVEREKAMREEERRIKKLKRMKGEDEERKRREERDRWKSRWKSLGDKDGDVVETELSFLDIPWPVYRTGQPNAGAAQTLLDAGYLSPDNIRTFIHAIAGDERTDTRKTVREAIRNYHPDRFNARVLERVKDADKDVVKQAVGLVSGILNDLAKEAS